RAAPPPEVLPVARLFRNLQATNRASAALSVTPPESPSLTDAPRWNVIPWNVTSFPFDRSPFLKRRIGNWFCPSSVTAAPAAARTVNPLRGLEMLNPLAGAR